MEVVAQRFLDNSRLGSRAGLQYLARVRHDKEFYARVLEYTKKVQ